MLLSSRLPHSIRKTACWAVIGCAAILAACSVQPLYSGSGRSGVPSLNAAPDMRTRLASIAIEEPADHMSQMVRNRLIFLLSGGSGQPANSSYQLKLNIKVHVEAAVRVDIGDRTDRTGRASAGTVIAKSSYVLKDMQDNTVARRTRSVRASFDRPRQEYANLQAEQDAKKRAAEELAEQIFLSLAQDFAR